MQKLKSRLSRLFNPLAVALVAVIALTSVIPIGATGSVPSVSANALSSEEQALVYAISAGTISRVEADQRADQFRIQAVEKAREEMNKLAAQGSAAKGRDVVYLGTNKTFYNSGWGVYWAESTTYLGTCESLVILQGNKNFATTSYNAAGLGAGAATAWVGNQFSVSGSGSRVASVSVSGSYIGKVFAAAAGGASAKVDMYLVVKDDTTGIQYPTLILSHSESFGGGSVSLTYFNKGVTVLLQGGHDYSAYISLEASASLYGVGSASSEWGNPVSPDFGKYMTYSSISINF